MAKLSLFDMAFLLTESAESPKHVGGLMIFKPPANKGKKFAHELYTEALNFSEAIEPFNQVLSLWKLGGPGWVTDRQFNIENHVFFHSLEQNDEQSFNKLVANLHAIQLPRNKPLWEFHIISGLENNRFACFCKIHHAYADGVTLARWLSRNLSNSPRDSHFHPLWSTAGSGVKATRHRQSSMLPGALKTIGGSPRMLLGLYKLSLQLLLERWGLTKNAVAVPFQTSQRQPLTGQVSAGRDIAMTSVKMDRVEAICKRARATLNHIALCCVDAGLRRYLADQGDHDDSPITIQMPVNLRNKDDASAGNKIGFVLVELARNTSDPYLRLREIGFTLRNVRNQVDGVPPSSMMAYSLGVNAVGVLAEMLGLSDRVPPLGHTLVSNVPGPKTPLYEAGAKLEAMYPLSALVAGNHLNITLFSYHDKLHFGLVASKEVKQLPTLAKYIANAFEELETVLKE